MTLPPRRKMNPSEKSAAPALGGKMNRRILGQPNRRLGEISLKAYSRYYEVKYQKLYYRVAHKNMTIFEALEDLGVEIEGRCGNKFRLDSVINSIVKIFIKIPSASN